MSPQTQDRYAALLRKAIRSLPDEEQDFVLEHLLKSGATGGPERREVRTEVRKIRKRGEGAEIDIDDSLEPVMIRLKRRLDSDAGEGEAHREVFVERVKGPLTQMVPMRLSEDQYSRFKKWCEEHDSSMAEIVRTLIERFLEEPTG